MEDYIILMETTTKDSGKMIKLMAMESMSQQLEENTKDIGEKIRDTGKESRLGPMEQSFKVTTNSTKKQVMVNSFTSMEIHMLE